MLRLNAAGIAGLVALFVVVIAMKLAATVIHPIPITRTPDRDTMAAWMAGAPFSAQTVSLGAWLVGAMAGSWLAVRLSGKVGAGWTVALLALAWSLANLLTFPHPLWMKIGAIFAPLIGGWLAMLLSRPRDPAGDPIDS